MKPWLLRAIDGFAIFLAAHLVFFAFTGLALWASPDDVQLVALCVVHMFGFFAPLMARHLLPQRDRYL